MVGNWNIKHQCPDCLSIGIKNLTELSLMFLSGLVVILFLGITLSTETVASSFLPWPQTGFTPQFCSVTYSRYRAQNTISPENMMLTFSTLCHAQKDTNQGENFQIWEKRGVISTSYPVLITIHCYFFLNRVRQNKTKQADSCDKDSVQGSNLLQLLTIFNLI